jgi:hypothetical protein
MAKKEKYPNADVYPVGKALQPFVHDKVGLGPGKDVGDQPFLLTKPRPIF